MPYLPAEGLKIHYMKKGKGRETILLLHGNVSSTEYWNRFLKMIPARYQAVALDQRGCGKTEHPSSGYSIPQFAEDLNLFTDRLGLSPFHLVGHSMGGQVSMLFTLKHPEKVRTLTLLDSVPADGLFLNDEVRAYFTQVATDPKVLRQAMDMVMPYGQGPSFTERAMEIALACAPQTMKESLESMNQTRFLSDLAQIAAPTLILHGKDDAVIPLEQMVPTMKAIVHAQVVIFTHCGHSPQVERPKEFAEAFLGFLRRQTSKKKN
jgi:pimeloyl-ACP methyl ester carboxylesterase